MESWKIGDTIELLKSSQYNIRVNIKKTENKSIKKYKSFIDMYTLEIQKLDENNTKFGLNFEHINLLELIMNSFYLKVMDYYKNVNNSLKYQLDLQLGLICNKKCKKRLNLIKGTEIECTAVRTNRHTSFLQIRKAQAKN